MATHAWAVVCLGTVLAFFHPHLLVAQDTASPGTSQNAPETQPSAPPAPTVKSSTGRQNSARGPSPEQRDLQRAMDDAANDRAAVKRNLLEYLKKYPDSSQRGQVYRAIVEASLQLRDYATATEFAERMVALSPEDLSINVLAVQLLERNGDAAGWRRATSYCSRVLDLIARESTAEKSPRVSTEEFTKEKNHNLAAMLLVRGRLYQKLSESKLAEKDFEESYRLMPDSGAAERLGAIAESRKDPLRAIHQYALAFVLEGGPPTSATRNELRKKLGNAWRLAHGSDDGLGEYLLRTFDELAAAGTVKPARNKGVKEPGEFVLRKAPEGTPFAMAGLKGKVVVMNFWATWCGPCREWEPHFEKVASQYAAREKELVFLEMNCDEDETLVAPYLAEEKPKSLALFADGMDALLQVNSFPTTVILDRAGKIAYRGEGFDPDVVDAGLVEAIERALRVEGSAAAR